MYEQDFTIKINGKDEQFTLKPLTGRYIGKFYKVLGALSKAKDGDESNTASVFDDDTITTLHGLIMATIQVSYPTKYTPEDLDVMVSKHILVFLEPLMKLNMPQQ
jgi:hypothetical protein